MFTDAFRDSTLGNLGGFLGLIKTLTSFRAGTVVEAGYTGYARSAVTWGAATNTTPTGGRQRANNAIVNFPASSSANEDQLAWGVWTLATGGVLQAIGFLDANAPLVGTGDAPTDLITTQTAHGLITDERVFVLAAPGAVIPTGLAENTAYFVLAVGLTTTAFKLSATSGGAAIDITAGGAALFMPYRATTVANGATPSVAIGAVVVQL